MDMNAFTPLYHTKTRTVDLCSLGYPLIGSFQCCTEIAESLPHQLRGWLLISFLLRAEGKEWYNKYIISSGGFYGRHVRSGPCSAYPGEQVPVQVSQGNFMFHKMLQQYRYHAHAL